MKKTVILTVMLLLTGTLSVWAQSGSGNKGTIGGRQGSSPNNNARKANTSQTLGNGVPYNKDAEQKGRKGSGSATTKKQNPTKASPAGKQSTQKGSKTAGSSL